MAYLQQGSLGKESPRSNEIYEKYQSRILNLSIGNEELIPES